MRGANSRGGVGARRDSLGRYGSCRPNRRDTRIMSIFLRFIDMTCNTSG